MTSTSPVLPAGASARRPSGPATQRSPLRPAPSVPRTGVVRPTAAPSGAYPPAVPLPRSPAAPRAGAPAPRPAAHPWHLVHDGAEVIARGAAGEVVQATIRDEGKRVLLELETSGGPVPARVGAAVVAELFRDGTLRSRRPVLAVVPAARSELLEPLVRHLADPRPRRAGATCLLSGRVP